MAFLLSLVAVLFLSNCRGYHYFMDMHISPAIDSQEKDILGNRVGNRPIPENTIRYKENVLGLEVGGPDDYVKSGETLKNPLPRSTEVLKLGQTKYNVFCAPCHGISGKGDGPVQKKMPIVRPLVNKEPGENLPIMKQKEGYFFHAMYAGFGAMNGYNTQMNQKEMWAVARYIKHLQKQSK